MCFYYYFFLGLFSIERRACFMIIKLTHIHMMKNKMYHILVLPPPTLSLTDVFMCQLSKLIVCFTNQWIDGILYKK